MVTRTPKGIIVEIDLSNKELPEGTSATYPLPAKGEIIFSPGKKGWVVKITTDGLIFNRECYPNSTPDDFAKTFMDILENTFTVKFYKKDH